MRAILEANTLRMSVPHMMTPETIESAETLCQAFEDEEYVGKWVELNWKFHSSSTKASGGRCF